MNYQNRLYDTYLSSHFESIHSPKEIDREYKLADRIFERNYKSFFTKKDAVIIDLGCGMGHFIQSLAKRGFVNAVGVDVSPEAVEFCTKHGLPVVKGHLLDYIKSKKSNVDCVVMNHALGHFTKSEVIAILDAVREALAPGGMVLLKVENMANPVTASSGRYDDFTLELGFTEISIRQVLRICGFKPTVKPVDIYVLYENPFNYPAKIIASLVSFIFFIMNYLYGRSTVRIFSKDILAIGSI